MKLSIRKGIRENSKNHKMIERKMEEISKIIEMYIEEIVLLGEEKWKGEIPLGTEIEIILASKYKALALYLGWSHGIAIRPNLSFISFDYDNDVITQEVKEEWKVISLVEASKRFPVLKELLPSKTQNAKECQTCNSLGNIPVGKHFLGCGKCLGLGWVDDYILFLSNRFSNGLSYSG